VVSQVPPVLQPPIEGGALDVENQEDHDRLDNDLLAQPAIPDFNTVLFSPKIISAFESPERHALALGMAQELLQQKDEIAKLAYARRVENNPHYIERGAKRFGNVPDLARFMPPGLHELSIDLTPGSTLECTTRLSRTLVTSRHARLWSTSEALRSRRCRLPHSGWLHVPT
jgi:hypothetical protein